MNQQGLTKNRVSKIKSWRLYDRDLPTIQLDLGVHVASILNSIIGLQKIKKLVSLEQKTNKSKVVHTVDSWINFSNNAIGKLSVSKYKIGNRNNLNIEIYGADFSLFKEYYVDQETNALSTSASHFYKNTKAQNNASYKYPGEKKKMLHTRLHQQWSSFYQMYLLSKIAKMRKIKIINYSSNSFLDCFQRPK